MAGKGGGGGGGQGNSTEGALTPLLIIVVVAGAGYYTWIKAHAFISMVILKIKAIQISIISLFFFHSCIKLMDELY